MMHDFRFASPEFLLLLLAVPLAHFFLGRLDKNIKRKLAQFLSEPNLKSLTREKGAGGSSRKRAFFWSGLILLIIALARPQANPTIEDMQGATLDIYVLLDVSKSMDSEDIAPSRLKKAKRSIQSLTQLMAGDRLGVIAFAGTAVVVSPLTTDYELIKIFLQGVDSSLIQNQGTDLGNALTVAADAMKRGAEKSGSDGPRSNVFILMSDGEDQRQQDYSVVDQIRKGGGTIFTIAFGTEEGGSIPVRNDRGELAGFKKDRRGNQVKTTVQTKSLQEIANLGGGQFYFSTPAEQEIQDIINRMQGLDRDQAAVIRAKVYQEYFLPFLALGLLLVVYSFFSLRQFIVIPKIKKSALSIFSLFLLHSASAQCAPLSFLWDKEKRASNSSEELLQAGKPEEAVDQLKPLLAEDPDSPALNYNVGTYLIEGKKNEEARTQLQRMTDKESPFQTRSLFNFAGSYAAEGKKAEARAAYADLVRVLKNKKEKTKEDDEILELTRKNLARLADPSQQPKDQKNGEKNQQPSGGEGDKSKKEQDGKSGEKGEENAKDKKEEKKENKPESGSDKKKNEDKKQENQPDKQSEKKPDNPEEKPGEEKKPEDGKGEESTPPPSPPPGLRPSKQKFRERDNMGEEDAKKILEALKQRETGLQKGLLRKKANGEAAEEENGNDW